jgi:transposase
MTQNVVGIDVHKHQHVAAMIDPTGREIATITISNTPKGYEKFVAWLHQRDAQDAKIGIENAASYGQSLTVALCAAGLDCVDVPPWRTHRHRKTMGPGKSDPIDAQAIARVVLLLGEQLAPALQPDLARALGILTTVREQEVRDRTKTITRLRAIWAGVAPADEAACKDLAHPTQVRRLRRLTLPDGLVARTAQDAIRMLARRIAEHNQRLQRLEADMAALLTEHGNPFDQLTGAATLTSAKLIAQIGDPRRFKNAAAFAAYTGTAPIPAGSGKTSGRHRLNRAGNRQLNTALHTIALVQARCHPDARAYIARRTADGKTPREARRALKRHLSNVVYRQITAWADAQALT